MNQNKTYIISGGAGFIGSNLCKEFLKKDFNIIIIDNFSLGERTNLNFSVIKDDLDIFDVDASNKNDIAKVFKFASKKFKKIDAVWHLAANSDIPSGITNPFIDHKDTFLTTLVLLETCKDFGIKEFNFASSSAVYGDWGDIPLEETLGPLRPISNYGAMKLASEAQICSARESYLDSANIFRFPNVVGSPATHGIIFDLINKLKKDSSVLEVLGNGSQKKSYLHVNELIDAMIFIADLPNQYSQANIINIGCDDDGILISEIAEIVVNTVSPNAKIIYGESNKGWIGDVPKFHYDISKLKSLGWKPSLSSFQAVSKAIKQIHKDLNI